jgi:hypothetical protein
MELINKDHQKVYDKEVKKAIKFAVKNGAVESQELNKAAEGWYWGSVQEFIILLTI